MAYIDGFVAAVPTANKEKFRQHGETIDQLFKKHGALQVIEAWGEDVPTGETTDFFKAVKAKENETIIFSWVFVLTKPRVRREMKKYLSRWKRWEKRR